MLHTLRTVTATWVAKIFIGVLIAGFALWGAEDFLQVQPDSTAVTVGDLEVSGSDFYRDYQRNVSAAGRRLRQTLTVEQAQALGLVQQTLQQIVNRSLYAEAVRELGLVATDEQVAKSIREDANFKDTLGNFSRSQFELLLANNGLNEPMYVAMVKGDESRAQLLDAVSVGANHTQTMIDAFYRYQGETRIVETLTIPYSSIKNTTKPTQSQIESYYKDHTTRFMAPEYRKITYITVRPEDLIGEIAVDEAKVKEAFEDRRDEFARKEKRVIDQMLFTDKKAADKASADIKAGKSYADVAKTALKQTEKDLALGNLTREAFLVPDETKKAVFAMKKDAISAPLKTSFGWALFRVRAITPGLIPTYKDYKAKVERDLKLDIAGDEMIKLSRKIEDALGGGDKLEDIARTYNLKLGKIDTVDARGLGRNGKAVKNPPKVRQTITHAFTLEKGEEPTLEESNDGNYFLVRVDAITKPAPRPIKTVTADIEKALLRDARKNAATKIVEDLEKKAAGGDKLAAITRGTGWTYKKHKALNRLQMSAAAEIGVGLRDKIFKASRDSVVTGENRGLSGVSLVRVLDVTAANDSKGKDLKKRLGDAIRQSIANDITEQFRRALEQDLKVEIDQAVIQTVLRSSSNHSR